MCFTERKALVQVCNNMSVNKQFQTSFIFEGVNIPVTCTELVVSYLQLCSFSRHTLGRTAVVHSVGSVEAVCSLLTPAGVNSPRAAVWTHITRYTAFHSCVYPTLIHKSNHNDPKLPVTLLKQLSLHEATLHLVSLTCCCAPDCFVCLVAVVGFVDFAHSCASAASSTPPSIALPLTPPLTPPAAGEHAQTAPPLWAASPLHCCLQRTNIR